MPVRFYGKGIVIGPLQLNSSALSPKNVRAPLWWSKRTSIVKWEVGGKKYQFMITLLNYAWTMLYNSKYLDSANNHVWNFESLFLIGSVLNLYSLNWYDSHANFKLLFQNLTFFRMYFQNNLLILLLLLFDVNVLRGHAGLYRLLRLDSVSSSRIVSPCHGGTVDFMLEPMTSSSWRLYYRTVPFTTIVNC